MPAGHYTDALMTSNVNPLEPKVQEYKFYARGVGPVLALTARPTSAASSSPSSRREDAAARLTPTGAAPPAPGRVFTKLSSSRDNLGDGLSMRILIVEDESKMAGLIHRGLEREGMAADVADNGEDALWRAQATEYDAIVLDVMLPEMDGFEVCGRLREAGVWSPILMLTARDAVRDRVAGLDRGADDYLTKPFSYAELLARLRALFRRGPVERPPSCGPGRCASTPRPSAPGAATTR